MHESIGKWNVETTSKLHGKKTFIDKIFLSIWQQFVCNLRSLMFDFPIRISFLSRRYRIYKCFYFFLFCILLLLVWFWFVVTSHKNPYRTKARISHSRPLSLFLSIDSGIGMFLLALLVKSTKMFTRSSLLFLLLLFFLVDSHRLANRVHRPNTWVIS